MQLGKVIHFHPRGFGFIESNGTSVFFHVKQIEGMKIPKSGDTLEFEAAPDNQGRMTVSHARIRRRPVDNDSKIPHASPVDFDSLTTEDQLEIMSNHFRSTGKEVATAFLDGIRSVLKDERFARFDKQMEPIRMAEEYQMENPAPTEQEVLEEEIASERDARERYTQLAQLYTQLPSQLSSDPPKWLIHEFIGESILTLIHGPQGEGKSMLALWVAKAIATGSGLLGRKGTGKPTPVIFVDKENPQSEVRKRLAAIGALDAPIGYWGEWRYPLRPPSAFNDQVLTEMADLGKPYFIFDSFSSFEEGLDENLPADMHRVMSKAHLLAFHSSGALVLHHDNKDGSYRGASSITAVPEMAIHLRQDEQSRIVTLSESKFRMCGGWTMKLKMPFDPAACEVISDTAKGASPVQAVSLEDMPVPAKDLPMVKYQVIKKVLKEVGKEVGPDISQDKVADLCKISQQTISRWEKPAEIRSKAVSNPLS